MSDPDQPSDLSSPITPGPTEANSFARDELERILDLYDEGNWDAERVLDAAIELLMALEAAELPPSVPMRFCLIGLDDSDARACAVEYADRVEVIAPLGCEWSATHRAPYEAADGRRYPSGDPRYFEAIVAELPVEWVSAPIRCQPHAPHVRDYHRLLDAIAQARATGRLSVNLLLQEP